MGLCLGKDSVLILTMPRASCVCSVSFHRSHTATVRSQVENPTASHVDNEYSQPPRNSHLSAYPGERRGVGRQGGREGVCESADLEVLCFSKEGKGGSRGWRMRLPA